MGALQVLQLPSQYCQGTISTLQPTLAFAVPVT
jgi:hypothetical protein